MLFLGISLLLLADPVVEFIRHVRLYMIFT
jgi:hypothetical protein